MEDARLQITLAAGPAPSGSSTEWILSNAERAIAILDPAESQDWEDRFVRVGQVEFEWTARDCAWTHPKIAAWPDYAGSRSLSKSMPW